jgi:hypothetical protein
LVLIGAFVSRTKTEKVVWRSYKQLTTTQCGGSSTVGAPTIFTQVYDNTVTYGDNYSDWRKRLSEGEQCTTVLSGTHYKRIGPSFCTFHFGNRPTNPAITCAQINYMSGNNGYGYGEVLDLIFPIPDPTSMAKANNSALSSYVSKVRGVQTTFQGGVFLGELKETIEMLVSPAKTLRHGLSSYLATLKKRKRQVKRVSPRKRLSAAKSVIADTWLEYAFGWRPLIHDIDDAMKTLANQYASSPRWVPVFAVGKDERFADMTLQSIMSPTLGRIYNRIHYEIVKEVKYRGQVNMVHPTNLGSFHAGIWNPQEIIPTVWELIPYSFLVDYFANIGAMISAASLIESNLRWTGLTQADRLSVEVTNTTVDLDPPGISYQWGTAGQVRDKHTKTVFSRTPYNGSLVPSLQFYLPGHDTQWINMAALFLGNRDIVPFHR